MVNDRMLLVPELCSSSELRNSYLCISQGRGIPRKDFILCQDCWSDIEGGGIGKWWNKKKEVLLAVFLLDNFLLLLKAIKMGQR